MIKNNNSKAIFNEQKNKLIKILHPYKNKILFPKEMICDLEKINGLQNLSFSIYSYNSYIKEARYLLKRIRNTYFWGYFFNKYEDWYISVNTIPAGIEKYKKEILKEIKEQSELIMQSLLIKLDSCVEKNYLDKITLFMSIDKNTKKLDYIYEYFDKNENKQIQKSLKIKQIQILLPLFSNSKSIKKPQNIENLYYGIPDLFLF